MLEIVDVDAGSADAWREIHNLVIPASPLSVDDVAERLGRHVLTLAYADGVLVGNATVRPPDSDGVVTVIVRVLPEHRQQGHGTSYLAAMLDRARRDGAAGFATVVLAANVDGLRFAEAQGFVEIERYVVDGAEYVDLEHRPG